MRAVLSKFVGFSFGGWINALISVISIPIITWLVLPAEFGKATMFTIAYNLIINFVLLGSDQSFIRFFKENKEERERCALLRSSLFSPLLFAFLASLVLFAFRDKIAVALFDSENDLVLVYALIASLFVGILLQFGITIIRMKGRAYAYSLLQVLISVSNVIIIIGYAYVISADFKSIVVGFIASSFLALLVSMYLEKAFWLAALKGRWQVDYQLLNQVLLYGLPFVPTFLSDWVFQSSDRAFLRIYSSFAEIGLFAAATKIANSLNVIKSGFSAYWVPFSYENYVKDPDHKCFYSKIFNLLSFAFFSFIITLVSFTDLILSLLPKSYGDTSIIFPILFFIPLLYTLSEVTSVGINFKKKPIWHLLVVVVSAITNVIIGYFLIRSLGALGAAISTLVAYAVFFCLRSIISIRLYYVKYDWSKFLVASLIAIFVLVTHINYASSISSKLINVFALLIMFFLYKKELQEFYKKMSLKQA